MRLKQTSALLLASALIVGSVGIMNPTEVRAAGETNTFTLTVPADTSITKSGWNDIGIVGVSNVSIASGKKISVTIENGATGRNLVNTTDSNKKVGYEIKKGNAETNEAFGTSLDFTANGTQAIGANVEDFSTAEVGTYEDTINFTAALASAAQGVEYTLTGSDANGKKLTSTALLASTSQITFTYDGTTYTAYNGYISETSGANWNDGVAFVEELNAQEIDGRTGGWTLLTTKEMAYDWWLTTDSAANKGASSFGAVDLVWTGGLQGDFGVCADCYQAAFNADHGGDVEMLQKRLWQPNVKKYSLPNYGFVVLRGSASAASAVTYNRTDSTGTLSTENLGTPTSWTYDGTTYQVYNEFIPSSSGSSWNDAMGFVAALNTAQFDGHGDWTLLSSISMAREYAASGTGAMPDSSARGYVSVLWLSVEDKDDENFAYCLDYVFDNLGVDRKSNADSVCGFVVLRGSSKSAATAVTYERTGKPALSSENLGTPTSWTYDSTTYQVYNAFIPSSSGSSWNDAMGFVAALNTAQFDGHGDWTLLSSISMAREYAASGTGAMPDSSARGYVCCLWSSVENEDDEGGAYCLLCNDGRWSPDYKTNNASSDYGFVVLRGSSN